MLKSAVLLMSDPSSVGEARRLASEMGTASGLDQVKLGNLRLIVTEAASNIVKHAREGQILLRRLADPNMDGIEVLAIDRGPGMDDVIRCMEDGYSTAGSPGTGLGAIQRLADYFDIFSQRATGTVVLAQVWASAPLARRELIKLGAVCSAAPGETECGDNWSVHIDARRALLLVADGLGHGALAAKAADTAVRVFQARVDGTLSEILQDVHLALRPTRGASVALLEVVFGATNRLTFLGVGNISGLIISAFGNKSMVSHNGTVGHELHRFQEFVYPWEPPGLVLLHSDGLQTRWNLDLYPGLSRRHPSVICGVLYRDFLRGRDDVTVLGLAHEKAQV